MTIQSDFVAGNNQNVFLQLCHHQNTLDFSELAKALPSIANMLAADEAQCLRKTDNLSKVHVSQNLEGLVTTEVTNVP